MSASPINEPDDFFPPWVKVALSILSVLAVALTWIYLGIYSPLQDVRVDQSANKEAIKGIRSDITLIQTDIKDIENRYNEWMKILTDKFFEQTKIDLSNDRIDNALRDLNTISGIIVSAKQTKIPVGPQYFEQALRQVHLTFDETENQAIKKQLYQIGIHIAEYKTVLNKKPQLPKEEKIIDSIDELKTFLMNRDTPGIKFKGKGRITIGRRDFKMLGAGPFTTIFQATDEVNNDYINTKFARTFEETDIHISGIGFVEGQQLLDGIHWNNVAFVDTHIKYAGGDLDLTKVLFINCTFEVIETSKGTQLIQYVALEEDSLKIG